MLIFTKALFTTVIVKQNRTKTQVLASVWAPPIGRLRPSQLTCPAMPAALWASAPQRWLCRGWSHTHPRCSPPWRSLARAACGAASLAKSAEGNFEPALTHREKRVQTKLSLQSLACFSTSTVQAAQQYLHLLPLRQWEQPRLGMLWELVPTAHTHSMPTAGHLSSSAACSL